MRRALALVALPVLLLAACGADETTNADGEADRDERAGQVEEPTDSPGEGSDEGSGGALEAASDDPSLDAITVTGEVGQEPTVEFEAPFDTDVTVRRILEEGDGEPLAEDASVAFHYVAYNGRDGSPFNSSYASAPMQVTLGQDTLIAGMSKGLIGVPVGSRVLVAVAPGDAFGQQGGNPEVGIEADDTVLFVFDVQESREPLERAEGTPVEPAEGLPTVELDEATGAPTVTMPEGDAPAELVVQPLVEGEGPPVEAGQQLVAHYTGMLWADGSTFDTSWERGEPATFTIGAGQVIPGWDEGLVGQPIGSQVLLVIPPDMGYGPQGNEQAGIAGDDTLVFVVDILDAYAAS